MGRNSYGKGTVQTHFPLQSVSGELKLTTAKFYSPSGRAIANVGVTPDIDVRRANENHLVGFRGTNNVNGQSANGAANGGPAASAQNPDKALEIAVGVVRELPVAQL